mgnify:CR=1 FL=1
MNVRKKIKLHIWFETFYIGNENPASNPQNILFLNPEWGNKTKKDYDSITPLKVATEHNGYFLDPANPEVRKFLLDLLEEIIVTYRPDGINLDYIRYPQAVADMNIWGYTQTARDAFKEQYKTDPLEIKDADTLIEWANFRRNYVSSFVKSVNNICKKNKVYLSAVIFPDRLAALTTKLQDWKEWSKEGYVDGFTPLFLTCDAKTASNSIKRISAAINPKTDLYAGIFVTFIGGSPDDLIRQIHETRKLELGGVILFDYAHISNRYTEALAMFFRPKDVISQVDSQDEIQKKKKKNKFFSWFSFE